MEEWLRHLPDIVDPVAFSVGGVFVRWYALMYIAAFFAVYFLLLWRVKREEGGWDKKIIRDCLTVVFWGVIIGGRLGYVLLYDFAYYVAHPLQIVSPFDPVSGMWTGISGMSYFGGLAGALLAGWLFSKRRKINFWKLADFIIPAVPAGYFFGRIGNFLNGELYGRATSEFWGMYFPNDPLGLLRHPSQLYEAFGEGLVLFVILWTFRNKSRFPGQLLAVYFFGYSTLRFLIEFVRELDTNSNYILEILTLGQIYAALAGLIGILLYWKRKNNNVILDVSTKSVN